MATRYVCRAFGGTIVIQDNTTPNKIVSDYVGNFAAFALIRRVFRRW